MLECKIPVQVYEDTYDLNFHDAWKKLSQETLITEEQFKIYHLESRVFNYYGNMANAQRSGDNEFYIFARYEDLLPVGHQTSLTKIFAPLISKTKKYFMKDIETLNHKKLVA